MNRNFVPLQDSGCHSILQNDQRIKRGKQRVVAVRKKQNADILFVQKFNHFLNVFETIFTDLIKHIIKYN